jgi:hypothetical protein
MGDENALLRVNNGDVLWKNFRCASESENVILTNFLLNSLSYIAPSGKDEGKKKL